MDRPAASELDEAEIDAFLDAQSTGTLSLASGDDAYAVPVAFTYAPESGDLYFRLGYAPGSLKREYVEATDRATFVVAAETDAGWRSVVARGGLEHRSTLEDLDTGPPADGSVSEAERELAIPFYHVFEAPSETTFALVRLRTDELTGVAEPPDD
jgi:nitroimidazol reductase NimA-like FMN-containing flavoprotein (pyridoxamine 5'-phosphate oxidase superfamily)